MSFRQKGRLAHTVLCLLATLVATAVFAQCASAAPIWRIDSLANSTAAPGESFRFIISAQNRGDTTAEGSVAPVVLSGEMPPGLTVTGVQGFPFPDCSTTSSSFHCEDASGSFGNSTASGALARLDVEVGSSVPLGSALTASFSIHGGALPEPSATTVDATQVASSPPAFGIDAFDGRVSADATGAPLTAAAAHPFEAATMIDFNTATNPAPVKGLAWPREPARDIAVDLPAGFVGSLNSAEQCSLAELLGSQSAQTFVRGDCRSESQVGVAFVRNAYLIIPGLNSKAGAGPIPIYQMQTPPGVPARFGFNVAGTPVFLDARVRSSGDYGLTVESRNTSEGLALAGSSITFWGVPASPAHDLERSCPGVQAPWESGEHCTSTAPPRPLLRNPTACTAPGEGLLTTVRADSWSHPGVFREASFRTHLPKGYPYPSSDWGPEAGIDSCASVPFQPSLEAVPTIDTAGSPTGLDLHLRVPQDCWSNYEELCSSDLRNAEVVLPQGMSLNPSAAGGLGACTAAQAGLLTQIGQDHPIHFDEAKVECPDDSKIGTVTIDTPLLQQPLTGAVYLAQQGRNPFSSLLAMYLVVEGSGVVVKQAGEIASDPITGRLTTVFKDAPQTPFSDLQVSLFGGPRAPLRTPPRCGTYAVTSTLTPWSGTAAVTPSSEFRIDHCSASDFLPKLTAGTENSLAGSPSPFNLGISRDDGTQELGALNITLPPGLTGYLKEIPYCPDSVLAVISTEPGTGAAQEASPACSSSSQIGRVTTGAGAGPSPFFTQAGRAYLAGPYKGAPLSIAVVAPAVAGPFDLGSVVVRNALRVDPGSAQITAVSDRLPTILHGIPLDLRDVRVELNRSHFTLNPTNCDEMQITTMITSTTGALASPHERFQAAGCDRLAFKPKLTLALKGPVHRRSHPSLTATLRMPTSTCPNQGRRTAKASIRDKVCRPLRQANIARAQVKLPPAAFLDNAHIKGICTRVQFAAHACPANSVYGTASATSPILGYPISGNVYLRSSDHKLPDLVADLRGPDTQPIEVALAGKTDSVKGALRNTFEVVPDAPVTKFTLKLFGKKRGLIEMSSGFCAQPRATVKLDGQNGRSADFRPKVRASCGKPGSAKKHRHRAD